MTAATLLFWVMAVIAVVTALGVVMHRNPVRSALLLIVHFLALAVIYVLLNAQVLAALQVIVYAGAIMVLFLFVILLLNLGGELSTDPLVGQKGVGGVLSVLLLVGLLWAIQSSAGETRVLSAEALALAEAERAGKASQVQFLGWDLFTRYVYPFELTSILLLVGVIGVIIFTRQRGGSGSGNASDS